MTARAPKLPTVTEILADGLDASTDGRGWGREHEEARLLANAAPELREVLRATLDGFWHYVEQAHEEGTEAMTVVRDHLAWAQAVLKKTELGHYDRSAAPPVNLRGLDSEQLAGLYAAGQCAAVAAEVARRPEYLAGVYQELKDRHEYSPALLASFARRVRRAGGPT